jgi:hypothetical protein
MSRANPQDFTSVNIPEPDRRIITATGYRFTIRTESNRSNLTAVTLKHFQAFSRLYIPQFERSVITATS